MVELKNRLVAELEQIRQLKSRIDSPADFQFRSGSNFLNKKTVGGPNSSRKILGNKRPFPGNTNPSIGVHDFNTSQYSDNSLLLKKCSQILSKLMKHKFGHIFNVPVDVVGMQLHDYYDIIRQPMDLGTVKKKLGKNLYGSPQDFAADVRLTFHNAMRYNPKGHDIYALADQLLARFEELFRPIKDSLGHVEIRQEEVEEEYVQEVQASSWDHNHRELVETERVPKDGELPVRTPSPRRAPPVKAVKLPKPKAKDPNKREMSLEEKHKLGLGLQSLPQEKMEQDVHGNERMDVAMETKRAKKGDGGDEEVDIGDEMPMSSFPPVQIEKDNGHGSSSGSGSSSSSDDSSSSSDSDSGSSSGSDSDDAHS
ncbi:Transcription factor GTE3, chloroplastic [Linum perenne]